MADPERIETTQAIPPLEERLVVGRHAVETGRVRARLSTGTEDAVVRATPRAERLEVVRVPVRREVAAAPAIRGEEGGAVLVVPVVVEALVTERRLVLKEERWIRRVSTASVRERTVALRRQTATVERLPAPPSADPQSNGRHDGAGDPT